MAAVEMSAPAIVRHLLAQQLRRRLALYASLALLPVSVLWLLPQYSVSNALVATVIISVLVWLLVTLAQRQAPHRIWQQLNDLEPALQDSAELLQVDAGVDSPLLPLQQQRMAAVLARQQEALAERLTVTVSRPVAGMALLLAVLLTFVAWPKGQHIDSAAAAMPVVSVPTTPQIRITVTPPAYTGLPTTEHGAGDVTVPDGSELEFCVGPVANASDIEVQWLDGESRSGQGDNEWCSRWTATLSNGYQVRWHGQPLANGQGRLLLVTDAAPSITIRQPEVETQDVDSRSHVLELDIQIEDDYGIRAATISWTLARGGGENVRFSGREQRLPAGNNPRQWRHQQRIAVSTLGMEPGDELYFHLTAYDNRNPSRQQTRSRTYVLRHPVEDAVAEGGARLPADLGKAKFRSQRQIILDTEALIRAKAQLDFATFRQRSEKLAQDQMILRLRYGEFLGEESSFEAATPESDSAKQDSEHDEGEAGHGDAGHEEAGHQQGGFGGSSGSSSVVAQFGHLHDESENATLFDEATKTILRRALRAMWASEGALRMSEPHNALPAEYEALDAIKSLQQADRIYLHKTSFTPPPLEESMRFSGDFTGAGSVQRAHLPLTISEQQRVAELLTAISSATGTAATDALAERTELKALLQGKLRSRDNAEREQALAALAELQALATGCQECATRLRDGLLPQLTPPLPRPQPVSDPAARWQQALQTKRGPVMENPASQRTAKEPSP